MPTMTLDINDRLHILTLTNDDNENTITLDVLNEYLAAFDRVEQYEGNTALLITCIHQKTFSTGINLVWLTAQTKPVRKEFLRTFDTVLYRLALLNAPTVACINGNAYAGGAIIAAAADFRIMRSDRGRFCLPEVDINMSFPPVMADIIDLIPNKHALKHMTLMGTAYTGQECEALNIVDYIYPAEQLQDEALALAKKVASKDRKSYTAIRNSLRPKIARHGKKLGLV